MPENKVEKVSVRRLAHSTWVFWRLFVALLGGRGLEIKTSQNNYTNNRSRSIRCSCCNVTHLLQYFVASLDRNVLKRLAAVLGDRRHAQPAVLVEDSEIELGQRPAGRNRRRRAELAVAAPDVEARRLLVELVVDTA